MISQQKSLASRANVILHVGRASLLLLLLAGCRHKTTPQALPPVAMIPIDLETPQEGEDPPMIESASDIAQESPLSVPEQTEPKPARKRKPAPPKEPAPPVQVASEEPAALAIGELSTGGDTMPQSQQQAKDAIASVQKRISALPAKTTSERKSQMNQVTRFLKQAQQALTSGDAEGAKNLATKASLLMDEIEKTS